ncbi:MAG: ATP-binding protein [Sulfurospirillaceae bacterium]|nr:ATP-binding protein [Sulfurospirillaceae bacterium]
MTTHTLSKLIKTEYLKSIIFPLLLIESMLLVAYFWSNAFVNEATKNTLVEETKISIDLFSKRSATIINNEFKTISNLTALFQKEHENFFKTYDPLTVNTQNPNYHILEDEVIYNTQNSPNECSLFFSNIQKNNKNRIEKAIASEKLDAFYNATLKANTNIAQLYFNSYDSMNRLCPFMPDALTQYAHNIDIPTYNFYYDADLAHNPAKKVIWTDAYLDPAGLGWMISAIAPVYFNNFLEGVVGIDVTIDKLISNILSIKLPYVSFAMLIDDNNNILAMSEGLEPIFGIKELTTHNYNAPVEQTISKPKDFNIMDNKTNPLAMQLSSIIKHNYELSEFDDAQHQFLITNNLIQETGWKLVILVDKESLLSSTMKLKNKTDMVGYIVLGLMGLFYLIFLWIIINRSQKFSARILTPLYNLIDETKHFKDKLVISKLEHCHIHEIDTLLDTFTSMSQELLELYESMDKKIKDGILENIETQKVMIYQSRLAQMGEMISMIAHQWRQPLGSISTVVASIKLKQTLKKFNLATEEGRQEQNDFLEASIHKIETYIQFLTNTIDDFRNFFKPDQVQEQVTLSHLIDSALKIIGKNLEIHHIELILNNTSNQTFTTYRAQMIQVLINILKNAQDAIYEHHIENGKIWIYSYEKEDCFYIDIEDNAGGIDGTILDKIFDPYFSTKTERNGTGLGLYMSKTIIEEHCHGHLSVINTSHGAKFSIIVKGLTSGN